jgi:hypothetical protein
MKCGFTFMSPSERYITKFGQPKRLKNLASQNASWASKRSYNYVIFLTYKVHAIQIAVPKYKPVNAKFKKGKVRHKLKKYFNTNRPSNWSPLYQVVAQQCFVTKRGHCSKISETDIGCGVSSPSLFARCCPLLLFLFEAKKHLAERKHQTRKKIASTIFKCLKSIPRKDYENL